jgi:hypothetical protein
MSINPLTIILPGLAFGVALTLAWPPLAYIRPWHVAGLLCVAAQLKGQSGVDGVASVRSSIKQLYLDHRGGRWRMHPLSNLIGSIGVAMAVTSGVVLFAG